MKYGRSMSGKCKSKCLFYIVILFSVIPLLYSCSKVTAIVICTFYFSSMYILVNRRAAMSKEIARLKEEAEMLRKKIMRLLFLCFLYSFSQL